MKRVDAPSAWSSPSDLDKKESDGRDPPQGVAPHAHRDVVGAHEVSVTHNYTKCSPLLLMVLFLTLPTGCRTPVFVSVILLDEIPSLHCSRVHVHSVTVGGVETGRTESKKERTINHGRVYLSKK